MQLRGFDSYEVTLGDLMRGERASLGKSLIEAEREMRIKANLIDAIENCDISAFKNRGVVSGYVRSYARYLGMDADTAFARFCDESGFVPPSLELGPAQNGGRGKAHAQGVGADHPAHALTQSRFAVPPAPSRFSAAISLSGLVSTAVLLLLVAGLGYGGYALLQEIQRVGFAPLPEAPAVVAEAPVITAPVAGAERPDASVYQDNGALAGLALPSDLPLPAVPSRDGPISAIDPETTGFFAPLAEMLPPPEIPGDAIEAGEMAAAVPAPLPDVAGPPAAAVPAGPPEIAVVARDEAWVRVRDGAGAVIFEGILRAGDSYTLPADVEGAVLRAGNAGEVFVTIGGSSFGPVGAPGSVAREVSLGAADVRAAWPASGTVGAAELPTTVSAAAD